MLKSLARINEEIDSSTQKRNAGRSTEGMTAMIVLLSFQRNVLKKKLSPHVVVIF